MAIQDYDRLYAQLRRIEDHREEAAEKQIRKMYKGIMKDLRTFIADEYVNLAEDGKLTYEILRSKGQEARFLQEVEQRVSGLSQDVSQEIRKTVEDMYQVAYDGLRDAVTKAKDAQELRELLQGMDANTAKTMWASVDNTIMDIALDKNHRANLWNIKREVATGLSLGDRFETIAKRIDKVLDGNYKKAILITRTEVHRVREAGHLASAQELNETLEKGNSGLRMVKKWKTMNDNRVRPNYWYKTKKGLKKGRRTTGADHVKMHNVVVEVDEPFDMGGGVKMMAPGQSTVAAQVCNCRCTALEVLMDDEEFFEATGRHFKNREPDAKSVENSENGDIIKAETATDQKSMPMSVYFNSSEDIYKYAKKVKPIDGYEDMFIHGDLTGFSINDANGNLLEQYTPREFAEMLKSDPNYHGGDIRLCACSSGADDAIAARALAKQLGVNVLAPSDTLWINPDGSMTIGPDQFTNTGKWVMFSGR